MTEKKGGGMDARTKVALVLVSLLGLSGVVAVARAQPGPDQKKLDYFVGKWRSEVDVKASASAPAAKASATDDCEWFANMHVVCRGESTGPAGLYRSMRVISYVPALKQYASYTVDSIGYAVLLLGQVQGTTWTFTADYGGVKTRYTMKTAKDSYSAVSEYAGADGKWTTMSAVNSTRAK
jgi:Protein of unknown function (DUF1579)